MISHCQILWKFLEHAGETYKVYGLSGVFAYPSFRQQGYGRQVVSAATAHIDASDGDIGMVHTLPRTSPFYTHTGWVPMESASTLIGSGEKPVASDHVVLMRFLSEKGRQGRRAFESVPFFFGEDI